MECIIVIDFVGPDIVVHWELQSESGKFLVLTLEEFLLAAKLSHSEAEFRASIYKLGKIESRAKKATV